MTGNHPIWSEDRHDYIAAMDLRVGERLKNLSGDTVWVQQKLPRPGPTPVYNLEVQDEHVYYVGTNGVLAHHVSKGKKKCNNDDDNEFFGNNTRSGVNNLPFPRERFQDCFLPAAVCGGCRKRFAGG